MRISVLSGTTLLALSAAVPVLSQEVREDSSGIEEVIVTAQRKEESAQKAGIAIDAVTAADLNERGMTSATDITKLVPAINFSVATGSIASVFMRGVGNITTSSYNDPAVTPSYDGVVMGRGAGVFGAAFYDLERVEVLKGPQGILYGRNATGGAINIIPARPEIGKTGGGFNLGYGNHDARSGDAHVNVAMGENAAVRLAGSWLQHDGYNLDGSDDARRGSVRGQFLYEPSEDLRIRVGGDFTHVGGKGVGGNYLGSYLPGPSGYTFVPSGLSINEGFNSAASNTYRRTVLGAPGFGFLLPMNSAQKNDTTYWGLNAELNWKTSLGELTVLPAYRKTKDRSPFYGPGFNTAETNEDIKQFSLEARLGGSAASVDYVVGGFYFNEKIHANNQYNQEFVLPIQLYDHKTESPAVFGQLTMHVSDTFRLIGGARYTHDHKAIDGIINNFIAFCGGIPPVTPPASFGVAGLPGGCANPTALPRFPNFLNTTDTLAWLKSNNWIPPNSALQPNTQVFPILSGAGLILKTHNPVIDSGNSSRVTWKASAELDVAPSNLLYATIESGYHSGGFQMTEGRPQYKPEYITAYSIGSKNRFLDNRLQLNVETFLWKYKDQQITYFTVDTSGTLINSNENAGRATIKGLDLDLIAKPTVNTTLSAKVQYLDTKYDDLHLFTAAPRDNFACPSTLTGAIAGGAPVKDFNCSGYPLLFSPKWTVNLGVDQVVPLGDKFELVGSVNTSWRDQQWGAFERLPFEIIPSYWTTDVNLSLRDTGGAWSVSGYVVNLEDKRRNLAPQSSPIGVAVGHYSAPMTYGLRVSANF